ncbi:MAG TPA: proliferating cell nuclear antigen (pcna) [Thermoplasmata archaeon]|jgi:proliferating cell nuclear antigen|nr:proliferating cell nuclear antigen (pcna) [Thermoplasmata archaeon]
MFDAKVKASVLKEVVDVVSTLVDEAKFNAGKDGLVVKAVDPAHVAMVDLTLDRAAFEAYKADDVELGLDLDKMKEVLKLSRSDETLAITHEEDKNRLVVHVGNITRRMSLVDTAGMSDPKVPNLNLPAKVKVRTEELRQGIRASESVSDHIALIATPDGFEIMSEGDTDSANLRLPKDMLDELVCKEKVRSLFPLDYFSNMIKAIGTAQTVTMHMGSDYPVKMEFDIAGGKGQVRYLLAPRIESE